MTSLERQWEARLKSEGLGARPKRSPRQALSGAVTYHNSDTYAESDTLARWTALTHAVNRLPPNYRNRHLLVTFCELGYVSKTAIVHNVSRLTVHRAIKTLRPALVEGLLYKKG